MIKVLSVNISEKKGTVKKAVDSIQLSHIGVEGDAHSGPWNRQVSLLGMESVQKFSKEANREINYGEFAENITTEGIKLYETLPLDRFVGEDVELEVTQIGKKCHGSNCQIFQEVGNCVMPKEGIFARVLKKGNMQAGDQLVYQPKVFKIGVITLSDRASQGIYVDKSGKEIIEKTEAFFAARHRKTNINYKLIPDNVVQLEQSVRNMVDSACDFIFTTGGTGIGPRDITPEVVRPMLDKEITGIMELIRVKYGQEKPAALVSRSIAGVIGHSLIYCLPGSTKAVNEYLEEIFKTMEHSIYMIHQLDLH